MKTLLESLRSLLAMGFLFGCGFGLTLAAAQNRPGEDPVVLSNRITNLELPDGGAVRSSPISNVLMPASMRAKVARYEAKSKANADAKSSDGVDFSSDKDVTRETSGNGFKKTCIQEVGSNTSAGVQQVRRTAQSNNQQIVVLRGDLVNICK